MSESDPTLATDGIMIGMTGLVIVTLGTDVLTPAQTVGVGVLLLTAGAVTLVGWLLYDLGILGDTDPPEVPTHE